METNNVKPKDLLSIHQEILIGGEWLGAGREWIKSNVKDGDRLEWSSGQIVSIPFCKLEELMMKVATAAIYQERNSK